MAPSLKTLPISLAQTSCRAPHVSAADPKSHLVRMFTMFQVRRCQQHQRKAQRKAKKVAKTPEQIASEKAERETKQAAKTAEAQLAKAQAKVEKLQAEAKAALEKAELLAKVAAEKGVPVSPEANASELGREGRGLRPLPAGPVVVRTAERAPDRAKPGEPP